MHKGLTLFAPTVLLAAMIAPIPLVAQDKGGDIMQKAVNQPGTNWSLYGAGQTVKAVKDAGVPGGQVMRVTIPAKGANAWDIGGTSPIQKPIAAGDTILVAVYLRAPLLKDGETTPIPFVGATGTTAPFASLASGTVEVGNKWKIYYGSGKAPAAFAGGTAQATVHLAAAKHVVDLGPIFVLDFGQNYDPAKLPKN